MEYSDERQGNILLSLYEPKHLAIALDAIEDSREITYLSLAYGLNNGVQQEPRRIARTMCVHEGALDKYEQSSIRELSALYFRRLCLDSILKDRNKLEDRAGLFTENVIKFYFGYSETAKKLIDETHEWFCHESNNEVPMNLGSDERRDAFGGLLLRLFGKKTVTQFMASVPEGQVTALEELSRDERADMANNLLKARLGDVYEHVRRISFHDRVKKFGEGVQKLLGNDEAYSQIMRGFGIVFSDYVAYDVPLRFLGAPSRIRKSFNTLREMANCTEEEFSNYKHLGRGSLEDAKELLARFSLSFRRNDPLVPFDEEKKKAASNIPIGHSELSLRAKCAFGEGNELGARTLGDLAGLSAEQCMSRMKMGYSAVEHIRKVLRKQGLDLKD